MISIIIITHNRSEQLLCLLNDLEYQFFEANLELIVINNNSSDNTEKVLENFERKTRFNFKHFNEAKQGSSAARNRGIKESSGETLVFLDDDVRLSDNWLENLNNLVNMKQAEGKEFAFGARVIADWAEPVPEWLDLDRVINSAFPAHDYGNEAKSYPFSYGAKTISNPITANFVCSRSLFENYGFFNEELGIQGDTRGACEDSEFAWRLMAAGVCVTYEPELMVYHPVPESRMTKSFIRDWYKLLGKTIYQLKRDGLDHLNRTREPLWLVNFKALLKAISFLLLWLLCAFDAKRRFAYSAQYYKALGEIWRF